MCLKGNKYIVQFYLMDFDVVIPLGPNEVENIQKQIEHVCKFVQGFRRIFVVSYDPDIVLDGCTVINENIFPFKMKYIADYFAKHDGKCNRNGWYFQQLLKLYAGQVIPDILPNYLVIDADVFFLKPVTFFNRVKIIDSSGVREVFETFFTFSGEYHVPYFEHMHRLHPSLKKHELIAYSGISHHMMFSTFYVKEMMKMIEDFHGGVFWKIFIESVKEHLKYGAECLESGASEYELYFNYMIQYHYDEIFIRGLNWKNVSSKNGSPFELDLDYVSICWYM